jgi:hypothetical protein
MQFEIEPLAGKPFDAEALGLNATDHLIVTSNAVSQQSH